MHPCCLWAEQDEIDGDPELYDCATCVVREQLDGLDVENRVAWGLFKQFATRLTADACAGAEVLRRLTKDVPDEVWPALWTRLNLLYDALMPPPERKT